MYLSLHHFRSSNTTCFSDALVCVLFSATRQHCSIESNRFEGGQTFSSVVSRNSPNRTVRFVLCALVPKYQNRTSHQVFVIPRLDPPTYGIIEYHTHRRPILEGGVRVLLITDIINRYRLSPCCSDPGRHHHQVFCPSPSLTEWIHGRISTQLWCRETM